MPFSHEYVLEVKQRRVVLRCKGYYFLIFFFCFSVLVLPFCQGNLPLKGVFLQLWLGNRTITRIFEGILFICGPSSIICARAERGCKINDATRATNKQYARQKSCYYHYHQYTRPYHEESMAIK